jgi:peptide deformylase
MKFEIIPDQQTPKVLQEVMSIDYIIAHKELFNAFLNFAYEQRNAVGLAANQCSLDDERFNQRIFALRDMKTGLWRIIVDPMVLEYVGMRESKLEGCLTWKGKLIIANRFRAVRVGYCDTDGNTHDEIYKGFEAQIWQHEINHLDGIPEDVVPYDYKLPKGKDINRNDACPCNSGKKYKQCCLLLL